MTQVAGVVVWRFCQNASDVYLSQQVANVQIPVIHPMCFLQKPPLFKEDDDDDDYIFGVIAGFYDLSFTYTNSICECHGIDSFQGEETCILGNLMRCQFPKLIVATDNSWICRVKSFWIHRYHEIASDWCHIIFRTT